MTLATRPPRLEKRTSRPPPKDRLDALQLSVMFLALVSVWRIQDLYPILSTIKIQYIAPALAILAFIADRDPRRSLKSVTSPLLYSLLGILLIVAASVPTSLWPGKSFSFLFNEHAKTIVMTVLMGASIRSVSDVERYAGMHMLGATIYCYFIKFHFGLHNGRLGNLVYYDANDLALLLVCTVPLCVYFLRGSSAHWTKIASSVILILLTYTLVKTGSRGGFIGLVACGVYLLVNFTAVSIVARGYTVVLMASFILVFGKAGYWLGIESLFHPTDDYNWTHDSGRLEVWKRGVGYMLRRPITGVGAAAFSQAEGMISDIAERQEYGYGVKWSAAHNSFVEVGAELGVIGLGLFLVALARAFKFVRKLGSPKLAARMGSLGPMGHAIGGCFVGYFVAGFFVSAGYSAYLYTIFGIVLGLMKIAPSVDQDISSRPGAAARPRSARVRPAAIPRGQIPVRAAHARPR